MTPERWQQVEELFQAASDPEKRAEVLARADPKLRTEVEALLAQDASGGRILDRPAAELLEESATIQLAAGAQLGPYQIEASIGAGGMGEVYRAVDTRLGRKVALKISATQFSGRFEREARAISALNHSRICTLYDVGPNYLVMELVEGETLAARLRKGPLPVETVLRYGAQIADALAAAHARGVIHRDLKPANIMVTKAGVKVLDFGLAKFTRAPNAPPQQGEALTASQTLMGTPAYMAPEQLEGKESDARVDIFALGLVLYEMAKGKPAFAGDSQAELIASVMRCEPAPLEGVPEEFAHVVERCLLKDPDSRWQAASDIRAELEWVAASSASAAVEAVPPPNRRRWLWPSVMVAGVATMIALLLYPAAPPRAPALRFTPFSFEQGGQFSPVWSPDGKAVAFAAVQKQLDPPQVYVRYLDSPVANPITHLAEAAFPHAWTSTGRIIFGPGQAPHGLWSVSPVGGEPEPVLRIPDDGTFYGAYSVCRDGSAVALVRAGEDGVSGVWISSPAGAAPKPYQPAPFATHSVVDTPRVEFSPDGKQILLFWNRGAGEEAWLMPYPPNPAKPPHRILRRLPAFGGTPSFSWMPDNRRVVVATTPGVAPLQLYMADTMSEEFAVLSSGTTSQWSPAVSPDGSKLVFREAGIDFDIVSVDLATAAVTPLIATQRNEDMPAWASGQPALVYVTDRNGEQEIWLHKPGQADRPLVTKRDFPPDTTQWLLGPVLSPDATRVIYTRVERGGPARLWMSATTGGSPVRLAKSDAGLDFAGAWSPDGNWFVYWEEKGRWSLNKIKTTGQAEPEVLKADVNVEKAATEFGGAVPVWSPAGNWILHFDNGFKLISPDGKTTREVASPAWAFAFSADGKMLYGIRHARGDPASRPVLFSMGIASGTEKTIGSLEPDYLPRNSGGPALRLTLTPDGKSITYSKGKFTNNLWLMEGLTLPKPGLLERLGLR